MIFIQFKKGMKYSKKNFIWKLLKMLHLNFSILVFSTIFCPFKNWTVWFPCLTISLGFFKNSSQQMWTRPFFKILTLLDALRTNLHHLNNFYDQITLNKRSDMKRPRHNVAMSHYNFLFLAFSTNNCCFKSDSSGNPVWPKASGFQKVAT